MIIGLTGGIATGKSLVSGELRRLGAAVVDADAIAKEVVEPGRPACAEIAEAFGPGVIKPDGSIDRKKLGQIIFSDPAARERLNAITHPRIRERMKEETTRLVKEGVELIVLDIALLIETGVRYEVDRIVVVYADPARQAERLMQRDSVGRDEAKKRISCQMDIKEKTEYADYVIDNSGTKEETIEQTRALFIELQGQKNIKKGT